MGGAGQKRGMGGGGGGGETKRKERRGVQTCVIRAENGRTRQLLEKKEEEHGHTECPRASHLTVVLTRVGPDCGSVQPLYRLTSCVSMLAEITCRDVHVSHSMVNKQQSSKAIREELRVPEQRSDVLLEHVAALQTHTCTHSAHRPSGSSLAAWRETPRCCWSL